MLFSETKLQGAFIIEIKKIGDERGFFGRSWCKREMEEHGLNGSIAQINTSLSKFKGTLRGLHFQVAPYQECKMIRNGLARCNRRSLGQENYDPGQFDQFQSSGMTYLGTKSFHPKLLVRFKVGHDQVDVPHRNALFIDRRELSKSLKRENRTEQCCDKWQ